MRLGPTAIRSLCLWAIWAPFALVACSRTEPAAPEPIAPGPGERAAPQRDSAEVEALRALGYAESAKDVSPEALRGVLHRADGHVGGQTYLTHATICTSELIDTRGRVLRSWTHAPCESWDNTVLLPDGDVLAIHQDPVEGEGDAPVLASRSLVRLSWEGELRWQVRDSYHHDVALTPTGEIVTMVRRQRLLPEVHPEAPVRDHHLVLLDAGGEVTDEVSLYDVLAASPETFTFKPVGPWEVTGEVHVDLLHPNSVEWMSSEELAAANPLLDTGHVLVCLRTQDSVAILDWETKRCVWSWGQGILSGPHDAQILPNGHLLVFDNGLSREQSRVLEVAIPSGEILWEYPSAKGHERFFTNSRGAAQRLPNGGTLITVSDFAYVLELDAEGRVVWAYRNEHENEEGEPLAIVRARRIPGREDEASKPAVAVD